MSLSTTPWGLGAWAKQQIATHVGPVTTGESGVLIAALVANAAGALGTAEYVGMVRGQTMGLILGVAIEMAMLGGATMRVYNKTTRVISLIAMLFGVVLSAFFNTANAIEVYGLTVAAVVEGAGVVLFAAALSFSVHWSHTARTARQMAEEERARMAEEERDRLADEWKRQQEQDMYQLSLDFKRQRAQLELEQLRAENEEKLHSARRAARVQERVQMHTDARAQSASDSGKAADRDAHKAHILHALGENPSVQKTTLAMELGISRRQVYVLISELKDEGKL